LAGRAGEYSTTPKKIVHALFHSVFSLPSSRSLKKRKTNKFYQKLRDLNAKSIYGISSYIKGNYSLTKKQIIAESEVVVVCKISPAYINIVIEKFPFLGGQFYCYLAGT
jgi:hypothetical protein